jgi:parvulin-like peptidyl-prolyl isomerase
VPKIEEVKERVRDELLKQRARDVAKRKATELAGKLKGAGDFDKAVKAAGVEPKTTELLTRDSPIPDLGVSSEVMDMAFKLPTGGVSDPISTDTGVAIIKVLEKQEVSPTDLSSNKDSFREDLLTDRRNRFFSAYMMKAKQKMRIEVNREALRRAVG